MSASFGECDETLFMRQPLAPVRYVVVARAVAAPAGWLATAGRPGGTAAWIGHADRLWCTPGCLHRSGARCGASLAPVAEADQEAR